MLIPFALLRRCRHVILKARDKSAVKRRGNGEFSRRYTDILALRSVFVAIALLSFGCCCADAQVQPPLVGRSQMSWQTLKIGGGGFLTNIDIACDSSCTGGTGTSTKVVRTDTYGA